LQISTKISGSVVFQFASYFVLVVFLRTRNWKQKSIKLFS